MITRHIAREITLQSLFNLDYRYKLTQIEEKKAEEVLDNIITGIHNLKKSEPGRDFAKILLNGVLENSEKIDDILVKAAPDWGIEKTAIMDRNILRLAIFEMLFKIEDRTPPRVIINEAIELAKTFGHKKTFKFISGVLGTIYEVANLEEVDNEMGVKRKVVKKMKVGAMPYYIEDGKIKILLVHNIFNKWTLPKGSYENENELEKSLVEILKTKLNVEGKMEEEIGNNKYLAGLNPLKAISKDLKYYLFQVSNPDKIKLNKERKGLNNLKWFPLEKIDGVDKYEDMSEIFKTGLEILKNKVA